MSRKLKVFLLRCLHSPYEICHTQFGSLDLSSSPLPTSQDDTQCGSCYGARPTSGSNCCNTCDEVRKAYSDMGWMVNENDIEQ